MEAIISIEIGMPMIQNEVPRTANVEAISKDLDMADEVLEAAAKHIASYQQRMEYLFNRHIKLLAFQAGDLVLRKVFENIANPTVGKFQPYLEGPYIVVRVGAAESYALNKLDWTLVPRMWNVMHLKRYYQ